ncbi:carboxymuconolactone decarboxylase family protein [Nocardioides mangrovi]|uniref:Carboxymuconolactone decarboxylase family protein n=1 Tax=Nocardioides mangrovi TaxID=2874580 RepID=A0ABS7UFH1_9ACTN|nr:carboxymuconolactone decarboxylase family protein [Nocardioides mangrovi]MBZ5739532.1 carboxymuconolactone decarboxylase family protein [Nocardioides mangrovi]
MARVPAAHPDGEVAERIRQRRPGGTLRPIDEVLLHSPRVADGWNTLLGTLRGGTGLRADLRELVVLRIAVLNDAPYEWSSHEADAVRAGLTTSHLQALRDLPTGADPEAHPAAGPLDALQRQVLRLTDTMTREVAVPQALFDAIAGVLPTAELVELVVTVAAYNMVSRLVVTMQVEAPAVAR